MNPLHTADTAPAISHIRARLRERGLTGYVAFTPSNLLYTTGFRSYFVSEWWRLHGTVLAFIPTDESLPVTLMLGDFEERTARTSAPGVRLLIYRLWVDLSTAEQMAAPLAVRTEERPPQRPEQWDGEELDRRATEALSSLGMDHGPVATDLPYLNVETWQRLQRVAPEATLEDFTADVYEIRLIKQEWEIERLRTAVVLSERGMTGAMDLARAGMTAADIRAGYQIAVATAALEDPRFAGYTDSWVLPTVGSTTSASYGSSASGLGRGDLVKFDCGTTVHGYRSDGGGPSPSGNRLPKPADFTMFSPPLRNAPATLCSPAPESATPSMRPLTTSTSTDTRHSTADTSGIRSASTPSTKSPHSSDRIATWSFVLAWCSPSKSPRTPPMSEPS